MTSTAHIRRAPDVRRVTWLAVFLTSLAACAAPRAQGPAPLYDFGSIFLNDGVGVRPGRQADRQAIAQAWELREQRRTARAHRERSRRARAHERAARTARSVEPRGTSRGGAAGAHASLRSPAMDPATGRPYLPGSDAPMPRLVGSGRQGLPRRATMPGSDAPLPRFTPPAPRTASALPPQDAGGAGATTGRTDDALSTPGASLGSPPAASTSRAVAASPVTSSDADTAGAATAPASREPVARRGGEDPGAGAASGRTPAATNGTSPPTQVASNSERAPARRAPPLRIERSRPVLGDGSTAGELLAAAQRLIGKAFDAGAFLAHILTVAAVDLDVEAPAEGYQDAVWSALEQAGKTFLPGDRRPRPGDLVFLRDPPLPDGQPAFTGLGVVETVDGGTVVVVGEVHGRVARYAMTPDRPFARRDESEGVELNTPVRARDLRQGPDVPVTAGALLAGYGRP